MNSAPANPDVISVTSKAASMRSLNEEMRLSVGVVSRHNPKLHYMNGVTVADLAKSCTLWGHA